MNESAYAGAIIYFLDRESGEIRKTMCYPITRIELLEQRTGQELLVTTRTFVAAGLCKWQEQQ